MADQSSISLLDSQRLPTLSTMDNNLFLGLNEAGWPEVPCTCNANRSCGRCYLTSPSSPFDSYNPTYPGFQTSLFDDPYTTSSTIQLPERPARPVIYTGGMTALSYYPPNIEGHVAGTYTLGDRSGTMYVQPNETLLTPVTTAPSVTEDTFNMTVPFSIKDLIGKGREKVQLEYQSESFEGAQELARLVDTEGYRIHGTGNEVGLESGIRALQKALSFHFKERVPATPEQLKSHLRSVRGHNNSSPNRSIQPSELYEVLGQYGLTSGAYFQLGIVMRSTQCDTYTATVQGFGDLPVLWLFYDASGEDTGAPDQWAAIIPNDSNNMGSYAAAVAKPAPMVSPKPMSSKPPNPSLLYVGYNKPPLRGSRPSQNNRRQPASPRSVSGRNIKGSKGQGGRGRRSGSGSHTPSEAGSPEQVKHHICRQCSKSFLYPKDLRRHETTHSHFKSWKCPVCPKDFTRKDNMKRHLANDHPYFTPPASINVPQ